MPCASRFVNGWLILLLVAISPSLSLAQQTRIVDNSTILLPEHLPPSMFSALLQTKEFEVPVVRRIAVLWGDDGVENVSFSLLVPPNATTSPGVEFTRIEGSYIQRATIHRLRGVDVSWINLSSSRDELGRLIYGQSPEVLFGRVQMGWRIPGIYDSTSPITSYVAIRVPSGSKIRYSSLDPEGVKSNEYLFKSLSGFIYVESPQTKVETIDLLLMLLASIFVILVVSSSRRVEGVRSWVMRRVRALASEVGLSSAVVGFFLLFLLVVGGSYVIGPSPRVNVAALVGPHGEYVYNISRSDTSVIPSWERSLELMLSFDVVDVIVVEDYKFSERSLPRWRAIMDDAVSRKVPVYTSNETLGLNSALFQDVPVLLLPPQGRGTFLYEVFGRIAERKKQENLLHLGWRSFKPILLTLVVASLAMIMMGAMSAGLLALRLREKTEKSVNRLLLCVLSFFLFFLLGVVAYTTSSLFLKMPLGWHGPAGRGITAISELSKAFGGGNFPRAAFALLGLGILLVVLVSRRRARISFSLTGAFGLLLLYLMVSTPLTAPMLFRLISGETPNTPPKDYFSRASVNSIVSLEYQFQEAVAGLFMAILGSEKIETWLSRGMIASLAFAGAFFTLSRNSGRTNAIVVPFLFLVISRLFARVGDLQIMKSLWTLPTALILASIVVVLIRALDQGVSGFDAYLARNAHRGAFFISFVVLPALVGAVVLWSAAGTDRLAQVVAGWVLIFIALLSARNNWQWRSILRGGASS